jgi:hypothetical protein
MSTLVFTSPEGTITCKARGDGSSTGWYFSELQDWYTIPPSKSDVNEREQAHGAFGISHDWRQSAALSAKVMYLASDHDDAVRATNEFNGVMAAGRRMTMSFDDGGIMTSRAVSMRSAKPNDTHGAADVQWSTNFIAPDPRRYAPAVSTITGVPVSGGGLHFPLGTRRSDDVVDTSTPYWDFGPDGSSGRAVAANDGKADTYPSLLVTGGLELGFIVTDVTTGQVVRFDRPIPVGSSVLVNQRTGRASIDGQSDVTGFLTRREFFSVGPGETHQIQFAPLGAVTGNPTLTLLTAPAYW